MSRTIAFANHKGGAGKTTSTVNLAAALKDYRVLLVDLDGQRSATRHLGVREPDPLNSSFGLLCGGGGVMDLVKVTPTLSLIPGDDRLNGADIVLAKMNPTERTTLLRRNLESYQGQFDFILLDCPPALGLVTVNALMAADSFLIPTMPEYLGLEGVVSIMELAADIQKVRDGYPHNLGILFNRTDDRVKVTGEIIAKVREEYGDLVFKSEIRYSVKLQEAPSHGQSIYDYSPRSPGRHAFDRLTKEFLARMALNK